MRASRLKVLSTVLWPFASAVACGPNKPAEPSVRPEPPAQLSAAPSSASAAATASSAPPAVTSSSPRPAPAPAASSATTTTPPDGPFASLLTKGKKVVYTLTEEVDTHDVRPGAAVARQSGRVSFTITNVEREGDTWVGEGTWASEGTKDDLLGGGLPPSSFRLRDRSLELAEDGGHTSLATEAKIASAPANTVCHHVYEQAMYGRAHRQICFDRQGLVRYTEENLHGPRTLRLVRVK